MKRKLICFDKRCSCKSTKLDDISSAACINQDEDIGNFVSKKHAVGCLNCMSYWCETVVYCFFSNSYFRSICIFILDSPGECTLIFVLKGSKRLILSCRFVWHWRAVTRPVCYISIYFSQVLFSIYCTRYHHQLWFFFRYIILGTKK